MLSTMVSCESDSGPSCASSSLRLIRIWWFLPLKRHVHCSCSPGSTTSLLPPPVQRPLCRLRSVPRCQVLRCRRRRASPANPWTRHERTLWSQSLPQEPRWNSCSKGRTHLDESIDVITPRPKTEYWSIYASESMGKLFLEARSSRCRPLFYIRQSKCLILRPVRSLRLSST